MHQSGLTVTAATVMLLGCASPDGGASRDAASAGPDVPISDGSAGQGGADSRTGGSGGQDGGNGGGGGGNDGGPDAAADFSVTGPADGAPTCGEQTMTVPHSAKTPDVIIAFDRSSSMTLMFGSGGGTRYTVVRDLLIPLVAAYDDKIRWGYEEFPRRSCPDGAFCCADDVTVTPAPATGAQVEAKIRAALTGAGTLTPTPSGLAKVAAFYQGLADGIKERWVLLSTDGQPTCLLAGRSPNDCMLMDGTNYCPSACRESVDQVKALAAMGVKTVVLGVSNESFGTCLEEMAVAGQAARPGGTPSYYPASNPAELETHLKSIVSGIAKPSCFIDLVSTPPDPAKVAVFFDGKQVPWDPGRMNGWDYEGAPGSRIRVYGSFCSTLEGFGVSSIDVRYGCPPCIGTAGC